jgi:hypothetical protein
LRWPRWVWPDRWQRDLVGVILDATAVLIALAALVMAAGWDIEIGSTAEWVGGFGAVAAVSVALWMAGDESRRQAENDKRRQAELIAAWISGFTLTSIGRPPDVAMVVVVANASDVPIYDVVIELTYDPEGNPAVGGAETHPTFVELIPPGDWKFAAQQNRPQGKRVTRVPVPLSFTDARGNHWHRGIQGKGVEQLSNSMLDEYGARESITFVKRPQRITNQAERQGD